MSTLGKRLDVLEQLAEDIRLREQDEILRTLAEERGIPPDLLVESYREVQAQNAALRAQGLTEAQIIKATAQRIGYTVAELLAGRDALVERFG